MKMYKDEKIQGFQRRILFVEIFANIKYFFVFIYIVSYFIQRIYYA